MQLALGCQRLQAEGALPVDTSATLAAGCETSLGVAVGPGGQIMQFEIERIVDQRYRLAGALVLKAEVSALQLQTIDTQRKNIPLLTGWCF